MHDLELTYSLVLPTHNRWANRNTEVYETVHQAIIQVFQQYQIQLAKRENDAQEESIKNRFLCFERRSSGDLLLGDFKVVGSAQRRSKTAILQHGSILLNRSRFAPELPGIFDLVDQSVVPDDKIGKDFVGKVTRALNYHPIEGSLTEDERQNALQIEAEQFSNDQWNQLRKRPRKAN